MSETRKGAESTTGDRIEDLPDQLLPAEVANFFRVSKPIVNGWLRQTGDNRPFPNSYKISKQWRIPKSDVISYAQRLYGSREG